jgi:hypothetical protein
VVLLRSGIVRLHSGIASQWYLFPAGKGFGSFSPAGEKQK